MIRTGTRTLEEVDNPAVEAAVIVVMIVGTTQLQINIHLGGK